MSATSPGSGRTATAVNTPRRRFRYDLTGFIDHLTGWLEAHRVGPGRYTRHLDRPDHDSSSPDAYGCAGAANIQYMLGRLPDGNAERRAWVEALQDFQTPSTGEFVDRTHSRFHTTAHCTAALELFEARPRYPLRFLNDIADRKPLHRFLDGLDWDHPWPASHDAAGAASALAITHEVGPDWFDDWLDWFDREVDPQTGMWRRDRMLPITEWPGLFANLGGSFHFHFVYEHLRQPWPYPDRVIDTALALLSDSAGSFAETDLGFKDIDLVFCLSRARRQTAHRFDDVGSALRLLVDRVAQLIDDPGYRTSSGFDDVHTTFGAVCAIAELQRAVPGSFYSVDPLRLVLDRRPFI